MTPAGAVDHGGGPHLEREDAAYPPEPWALKGNFAVGVFLVPVREIPAAVLAALPAEARPLVVAGRAVVGAAAVNYTPGGVLEYDELLVAIPVVRRWQISVTIPQIWVTSPASRSGGRALWGIPKELMYATRHSAGPRLEAMYRAEDRAILAEVTAIGRTWLPGRWRLPLPTLQRQIQGDGTVRSLNSVRGRISLARTEWAFGSSLAWLRGRKPVLSAALTRAAVTFGSKVERIPD